jgi:hypothetical protein
MRSSTAAPWRTPLVARRWHLPLLGGLAALSVGLGAFEQTRQGWAAWFGRGLIAGALLALLLVRPSRAGAARWQRAMGARRVFTGTRRNAPFQ